MKALHAKWVRILALSLVLALLAAALVGWLNVRGEAPVSELQETVAPSPELVRRGAYLAKVGNCAACHTSAEQGDFRERNIRIPR